MCYKSYILIVLSTNMSINYIFSLSLSFYSLSGFSKPQSKTKTTKQIIEQLLYISFFLLNQNLSLFVFILILSHQKKT